MKKERRQEKIDTRRKIRKDNKNDERKTMRREGKERCTMEEWEGDSAKRSGVERGKERYGKDQERLEPGTGIYRTSGKENCTQKREDRTTTKVFNRKRLEKELREEKVKIL